MPVALIIVVYPAVTIHFVTAPVVHLVPIVVKHIVNPPRAIRVYANGVDGQPQAPRVGVFRGGNAPSGELLGGLAVPPEIPCHDANGQHRRPPQQHRRQHPAAFGAGFGYFPGRDLLPSQFRCRGIAVCFLLWLFLGRLEGRLVLRRSLWLWEFPLPQQLVQGYVIDLAQAFEIFQRRLGLAGLPLGNGLPGDVESLGQLQLGKALLFSQGKQLVL